MRGNNTSWTAHAAASASLHALRVFQVKKVGLSYTVRLSVPATIVSPGPNREASALGAGRAIRCIWESI